MNVVFPNSISVNEDEIKRRANKCNLTVIMIQKNHNTKTTTITVAGNESDVTKFKKMFVT